MRNLLLFMTTLLGLLVAGPAHADPADIAAASRSVVRVVLISDDGENTALMGHGSGFAVAPNVILTNAHVVEAATESDSIRIGIVPPQGKGGWFAKVIAYAPGKDLALLRLTERGSLPAMTLYTGAVDDAAEVFAIGYPGNVDLAQGLGVGDIVSPTSPVKARGYVSSGRSSKQFETLLHTAPIGAGNSGGPLLDGCGRVIGANSFGTLSGDGDSEFYFAVSMREIMRFLMAAKIQPQSSGVACRGIADLDRAEAERLAGEKALSAEEARALAEKAEAARHAAEQRAQREIIGERENGMALAGLAVLLALVAGGVAFFQAQKQGESEGRPREVKIAAILTVLLLAGAVIAWLARPSLDDIDKRAKEIAEQDEPSPSPSPTPSAAGAENLVCVLDPARSRVTVSPVTDVPVQWSPDGCVNARSQYGLAADGWSRILVPNDEDTATVAAFDPKTRVYRTERYLLDLDTMTKLRAERAKYAPPACGKGEEAARKLGDAQAAVKALLPATPNERMVYKCQATADEK